MSYDDLVILLKSCEVSSTVTIQKESRLREDLLMSSFAMMVLVARLEEYLHQDINPAALADVYTVSDLQSFINKQDC